MDYGQERLNAQCALWTYIEKVKKAVPTMEGISRAAFYSQGKDTPRFVVPAEGDSTSSPGSVALNPTKPRTTIRRMWDRGGTGKERSGEIIKGNLEEKKAAEGAIPPSDKEVNKVLRTLTNLEMSMLSPAVQFAKYRKKDVEKVNPFILRLDHYNANTIREFFGETDHLADGAGKPDRKTLGGIGVKSIDLEYLYNRRSGNSYNEYKVTAVIAFNSFEDMIGEMNFADSPQMKTVIAPYSTDYTNALVDVAMHYNALDVLIGFPKEIEDVDDNGLFKAYSTHLDLGYTEESVEKMLNSNFVKDQPEEMRESIEKVLKSLSFSLDMLCYKWSFDFQEGGNIDLTIEYIAFEQGVKEAAFSNILLPTQLYEEVKRYTNDLKILNENNKKGKRDKVTDSEIRKKLSKEGRLAHVHGTNKGGIYTINSICPDLKDASGKTGIAAELECLRVYGASWITKELLKNKCLNYAYLDPDDIWKRKRELERAHKKTGGSQELKAKQHVIVRPTSIGRPNHPQELTKKSIKHIAKSVSKGKATSSANKYFSPYEYSRASMCSSQGQYTGNKLTYKEAKSIRGDFNCNDDDTTKFAEVQYFYLGDLFQIVADRFRNNMNYAMKKNGDVPVFIDLEFGNMEFRDLRAPRNGPKNIVNIADLPISYDLFHMWWINKVSAPETTVYKFGDFIRDFFKDVVRRALESEQCSYKDKSGVDNPRPPLIGIHEVMYETEDPGTKKKYKVMKFFFYHDEDDGKDFRNAFEVWFGHSRGIVKNIKFKKRSNAFLRSSAMSKAASGLENPGLSVLREIYDAEVITYGNSYLQPGMYLEIQPSILGLGDVNAEHNKSLKIFGLGGYYAITKTIVKMTNGKFETRLTGFWQSTPKKRVEEADEQKKDWEKSVKVTKPDTAGSQVSSGVSKKPFSVATTPPVE